MKISIGIVDTLKICFVHGISTTHLKYKNIGTFMMDTLVLKMRKENCDMIEISPLQRVLPFYELLGYVSLYGTGPYYKWISKNREDSYVTLAYSKKAKENL
jgi:ABC-type multidrug transport system permease subunit